MMQHALAVLLLTGLTVGLMLLMFRGWNNRGRKIVINDLPALPDSRDEAEYTVEGIYVSSTLEALPYERVVSQHLGIKAAVVVHVRTDGVLLQRQGATDIFIPKERLKEVGRTAGMIGKFAAHGSIVVLRWDPDGATTIDSGIHIRSDEVRQEFLTALRTLLGVNVEPESE